MALGSIFAVLLAPLSGVAHAFDGSASAGILAAALPGLLPAALVLGLSWWRPASALWATAVAGGFGLVRLGGDVDVLAGPDSVVRPELFFETTLRAHPFGLSVGSGLLIVGDLVMVAGAILAARLIGGQVGGQVEGQVGGPVGGQPGDPVGRPRPRVAVLVLGLIGAVLAVAGAVIPAYAGGYLTDRLLPAGTGVWSLVAVLPLALLTGGSVVAAARSAAGGARAGLGAVALTVTALAVAAPALVALLAVAGGVDLSLTGSWLVTLTGAVLLGGAAVVAAVGGDRRSLRPERAKALLIRSTGIGLAGVTAILGVAAAVAALLAATRSGLLVDGRPDGPTDSGLATGYAWSAPIGMPFALVAGVTAVGAVLAAIPRVAAAGRILVALSVAANGYAVTQGLLRYQQVASLAPDSATTALFPVHRWSIGAGLWWGVAGFALALLAALAAIGAEVVARRDREAADTDAELARWRAGTDPGGDGRDGWAIDPRRLLIGIPVLLLIMIAAFLPVYSTTNGPGPAASFYAVGSVGVWLLTAGALAGVLTTGLVRDPVTGSAGALGAAVLVAVRWPVPASLAALPGYRTEPGRMVVAVVAVATLLGGLLLVAIARGRSGGPADRSGPGGRTVAVARSAAERNPLTSAVVPGSTRRTGRPGTPAAGGRPHPNRSAGGKRRRA